MSNKDCLIILLTIWLILLTLVVTRTYTGMLVLHEDKLMSMESRLIQNNLTLTKIEENIETLVNHQNLLMNITEENFDRLYTNYRILAEELGIE